MRRKMPWRPGARDLLAKLRTEEIPCALVTMSWRRMAEAVLAELPRGSFAATIVGDEVRRGKPHPEPYLAAARALSVSPRDCVVLEDSPTGVRSATAAGCHVIVIPHIVDVPRSRGHRQVGSLTELSVDTLIAANPPRRRALALAAGVLVLAVAVLRPQRPGRHTEPPTPMHPDRAWVRLRAHRTPRRLASNGRSFDR